MKQLLPILLLLCSCSANNDKPITNSKQPDTISNYKREPKIISDSTNKLTGKVEELELNYIAWGCACANWITPADEKKYADSGLAKHCIFIEPADTSLEEPVYSIDSRLRIKVKGQFYVKKDYPQGTIETEEQLDKARVFRYTQIKILKNK